MCTVYGMCASSPHLASPGASEVGPFWFLVLFLSQVASRCLRSSSLPLPTSSTSLHPPHGAARGGFEPPWEVWDQTGDGWRGGGSHYENMWASALVFNQSSMEAAHTLNCINCSASAKKKSELSPRSCRVIATGLVKHLICYSIRFLASDWLVGNSGFNLCEVIGLTVV